MIDLALRSAVLAGIVLVALFLSHRASASVRHLIAFAGLSALLALPVFMRALPSLTLDVLPAHAVEAPTVVVPAAPMPPAPPVQDVSPIREEAPKEPLSWLAIWPLVSLLLLARWIAAWLWLAARLRQARPMPGLFDGANVVESEAFSTPFVAWSPRPVVVLPTAWREWPAERLDAVLRHEAAHLRRGDGAALLIARLAVALFPFNPLVWLLARAQSALAELAADDLVVSQGVPAAAYAGHLLALAREPRATGPLPALSMARKAEVAHRVEMLLKPDLSRTLVPRLARRAALLLALVAAVPVAALAFEAQAAPALASGRTNIGPSDVGANTQVLLKCKFVQTTDPGPDPFSMSPTEPRMKASGRPRVVSAPVVRAILGKEQRIAATIDGENLGASLQLEPGPNGGYRLHVRGTTTDPATLRRGTRLVDLKMSETFSAYADLRAGEWVRFRLPNAAGKYSGLQALVQLVPSNDGKTPPQSRAAFEAPPTIPDLDPTWQGTKPRRADASRVAPVPIILRCQVFQGKGFTAKGLSASFHDVPTGVSNEREAFMSGTAKEILPPKDALVVTSPVVRTLSGEEATVGLTLDGVEHKIRMLPKLGKDGRYVLQVAFTRLDGDAWRVTESAALYVCRGESLIFGIPKATGKGYRYQMIVRVSPT